MDMRDRQSCQPATNAADTSAITGTAPGPELAELLATIDPDQLDPGQRVDLLVAFERLHGWLAAGQARVLASLDAAPIFEDGEWTREEVATALRLSAQAAQRRIDVARALSSRLPATWSALARGDVSYLQALTIAEATEELDPSVASAVEQKVLIRAVDQTVAELRRSVRRAVLAADPIRAEAAHERAVVERTVQTWSMPDGMAEIRALLAAPDAATVMAALNALARRRQADDPGGIDARRADAFVAVFAGALADPELPRRQRARPHVQVTVPASTLLGLEDHPGELAGYGPITAGTARRLAGTGVLRRLLTDPVDGRLLDYGRRIYRPPADLANFVMARDQVCTFPGCAMPAWRCELDHRRPWAVGGTTDSDNMHLLCRRHHRAKDHGPWRAHRNRDGSTTWISPTGRIYRTQPPTYDDP
jgi:Domain of unknown function (DUF222)/HNH endonuclease